MNQFDGGLPAFDTGKSEGEGINIWCKYVFRFDVRSKCQLKHRKNCECCPRHSLFKGHKVIVNIVVLNCQQCQCLKCQVLGHKILKNLYKNPKIWKFPKNLKIVIKNCHQKMSSKIVIKNFHQKLSLHFSRVAQRIRSFYTQCVVLHTVCILTNFV